MRREIEARFEEKLKLKILEVERLSAEVARLKQAGEQLGPVLTELEHTKAESRHAVEHKDREIQNLQGALRETQAAKQKVCGWIGEQWIFMYSHLHVHARMRMSLSPPPSPWPWPCVRIPVRVRAYISVYI
jgi:hypothetical protein